MRYQQSAIAVIIAVCLCLSIAVRSEAQFSIEPRFGYVFGETEYDMNIFGINPDTDSLLRLRSLLEFPLDAYMAGAKIEYLIVNNNRPILSLELDISTNITDTDKLFKDHDWWTGYVDSAGNVNNLVYFDGKFSYTESEIDLKNFFAELKIRRHILLSKKFDLYLYLGYRHHEIDIEAFGYEGWQYDLLITKTMRKFDLYHPDTLALIYRATYRSPFAGLHFDFKPVPQLHTGLQTSFMYVYASDYDHHLLTRKDAKASGSSIGFGADIGVKYYFTQMADGGVFANLSGNYYYSSISGTQTQNLYDAGLLIPGIPHKFVIYQAQLNFSIGYQF
jgi:hypothetical protein